MALCCEFHCVSLFFFSTQHGIFKICSHCDVDISFFAPDHCLIFHGEFPATHPPWVGMKDASTSHTRNDAGTDAVFLGTSLGGSVENFSGAVFQEEGHGVVHITPFTSTLSKAHVFFFFPQHRIAGQRSLPCSCPLPGDKEDRPQSLPSCLASCPPRV